MTTNTYQYMPIKADKWHHIELKSFYRAKAKQDKNSQQSEKEHLWNEIKHL